MYSAKLYIMWLKKVIGLLGEDVNDATNESHESFTFLRNSDQSGVSYPNSQSSGQDLIRYDALQGRKKLSVAKNVAENDSFLTYNHSRKEKFSFSTEIFQDNFRSESISRHSSEPIKVELASVSKTCHVRGDFLTQKEILKDDPLWSSGSLAVFPLGQSPNRVNETHLSGRFSPTEPRTELSEIIQEHQKSFPDDGYKQKGKFLSPLFAASQESNQLCSHKVTEIVSPWKQASSIALDLPSLSPFLV